MLNNPHSRGCNILFHGGGYGAYHPALPVAVAHLLPYLLCLGRIPKLVPALLIKIAHDLFFLRAVTGHYVAVGVNEEGVKRHIAGQKPFLAEIGRAHV